EEDVARALVELQVQPAADHRGLEQAVARRELHRGQVADVPRADDLAPRVGLVADLSNQLGDLVDVASVGSGPVAPLLAVDRPEVAVGVGPFVPDADAVLLQVAHVGVALQEPQQLVHDRTDVQLLRRDEREAVGEVETHLVTEYRAGAGAGPVGSIDAVAEDPGEQVEIGPHPALRWPGRVRGVARRVTVGRPARRRPLPAGARPTRRAFPRASGRAARRSGRRPGPPPGCPSARPGAGGPSRRWTGAEAPRPVPACPPPAGAWARVASAQRPEAQLVGARRIGARRIG